MNSTVHTLRKYDHRLRDLVRSTGDIGHAERRGVRPSRMGGVPVHPDFPDAAVLDGMIRAGTPVIQAFLAILTGASNG